MLIENIFTHLFYNESYYNVVFPYLRKELFVDLSEEILFRKMKEYVDKYSKRPTMNDITLTLSTDQDITEEQTDNVIKLVKSLRKDDVSKHTELVVDETESWVKDREMEMAILESVDILQNHKPRELINQAIEYAQSISFKADLGIEYDADESIKKQHEYYTADDELFKTDIGVINEAVGEGFRRKSLYVFIGRVNVGKTIWMCHLAASFLRNSYNVIYITAEMADKQIRKRIDANMMDMETIEFNKSLVYKRYYDKVKAVTKEKGKLYVKEYPTGYASKTHISNYIRELKIKKGFKPDIIILDYVNIFASARLPATAATDSYKYMKAVTEEFRAIAVEEDIVMISPTQLNRESAYKSIETVDMSGQSDSWAIPATADFMGVIIQTEEMYDEHQYLLKVIKTRFDENVNDVYSLGVNRRKMTLIEVDKKNQQVPLSVQDTAEYQNARRDLESDQDTVWVFDGEL